LPGSRLTTLRGTRGGVTQRCIHPHEFPSAYGSKLQLSRRPTVGGGPTVPSARIETLIVITMYNEKMEDLDFTLDGICDNIDADCERNGDDEAWKRWAVCIIADGRGESASRSPASRISHHRCCWKPVCPGQAACRSWLSCSGRHRRAGKMSGCIADQKRPRGGGGRAPLPDDEKFYDAELAKTELDLDERDSTKDKVRVHLFERTIERRRDQVSQPASQPARPCVIPTSALRSLWPGLPAAPRSRSIDRSHPLVASCRYGRRWAE
jgi:hypothetical protein